MIATYIEVIDGKIKKSSLEALSLAKDIATAKGIKCLALSTSKSASAEVVGSCGADELIVQDSGELDQSQLIDWLCKLYSAYQISYIVLANSSIGKAIGGQIAAKLQLGIISGVNGWAAASPMQFRRSVFSGKANAWYSFMEDKGVISVMPNSIPVNKSYSKVAEISESSVNLSGPVFNSVNKELVKGKTPLTEAEVVVSGGRGLKDPSNWGMIEELADLLNAATACSRPVADSGWRPHHEHVGQTGIAIRPNLYIAIGISGAIQHLAGVNNSRKIIVINKDPEAPFFKAADYGVVGDLFEVVPKLNEAISKFKEEHH